MQSSPTLMERLKADTSSAHDSAEGSGFQAALASGDLPLAQYRAYLGQIYLIHNALETGMKNNENHPALSTVITDVQYQEPVLSQDLQALGVKEDGIKPLKATTTFLCDVALKADLKPYALLGYHYVLLGSKHGGKFIAHNLQKKYKFENGVGCRYFDPYGPAFSTLWQEFKQKMNAVDWSASEQQEIIDSARGMFRTIQQICEELESSMAEKA